MIAKSTANSINGLVRGEISAMETYDQALQKVGNEPARRLRALPASIRGCLPSAATPPNSAMPIPARRWRLDQHCDGRRQFAW